MKLFSKSVFVVLFYSLLILPSVALSADSEKGIGDYYASNDHAMVAKLLEQQIKLRQDKEAADNKTANFDNYELYRLRLFLANTYAWKLNKFDAALAQYQKATDRNHAQQQIALAEMAKRQMPKQDINTPPLEFLFIAGMYEQKKDYKKALEYYQKILQVAHVGSDNASDTEMAMIGVDFIYLVQYAIDSIQLKLKPSNNYKPLLKKLNLLHATNPQALSFMISQLLPEMEYAGPLAEKIDLQNFIKSSPAPIHSMLLEYGMVVNVSAGSMSPSVQAALAAFLDKYPDSYFSLSLRNLLVRYYTKKGEQEKAKRYMTELTNIARSRNMELVTEPDKQFATPEATWGVYCKALRAGKINAALSCHIPGDTSYREAFYQLGPEIVKQIGNDMGPIQKITSDNSTAKYQVKHKEGENEVNYSIDFVNIYGEWKIEKY